MAQTMTKKMQKRLKREGSFDFTQMRGGQAVEISILTKRTKSKKEFLQSKERKHRQRQYE